MTLDKFLSTPNACIICNTAEDFKFLQKIFIQKNIKWSNGKEFNDASPRIYSIDVYPIYITSNCKWGVVSDIGMFSKITTILDMEAIDDFYDERITIQEFINSKEKLAIHVKSHQEALKLLDRFQLAGIKYSDGCSYLSKEIKFGVFGAMLPYGIKTCYTNTGTYADVDHYINSEAIKVYEFEEIDFNITFTDFFKRPNASYYFEDVRVVNFKTEDQMNKFIAAMKSKGMIPPTTKGFAKYADKLCFTNVNTYADIECYHDQKEPSGEDNANFAPIYSFDEIIFD